MNHITTSLNHRGVPAALAVLTLAVLFTWLSPIETSLTHVLEQHLYANSISHWDRADAGFYDPSQMDASVGSLRAYDTEFGGSF